MQRVNIDLAKSIVRKVAEKNLEILRDGGKINHIPLFLHSSPGIGKSSIVRQVSDDLQIKLLEKAKKEAKKKKIDFDADKQLFGFVDVRLAQMEQSDVAGIPYVSHAGESIEEMKISVPTWFPSQQKIDDGEVPEFGIIFFDELSNAAIGVQHAAYGVILDREVHGIKMGKGWQILAAGNLKEDKTGAKGVAPALANRFGIHIEIKASLEAFIAYALKKELSTHIVGYLNFKASSLYMFDPAKNDLAFATPRSWEQVSNILSLNFNAAQLITALNGCIGEATASDFLSFRKYYEKLPDFQKIMSGEEKYTIPKGDQGLVFAVTSSLIVNLFENHTDKKKIKNLQKLMDQLEDDFLILVYKSLKSFGDDASISNIAITTIDTYNRVGKYVTSN